MTTQDLIIIERDAPVMGSEQVLWRYWSYVIRRRADKAILACGDFFRTEEDLDEQINRDLSWMRP